MAKRNIRIIVAVAVGLVVLIFMGRWFSAHQSAKQEQARMEQTKKQKQKQEQVRRAADLLHQVCRYADSVGIDTTRFAAGSRQDRAQLEAKLTSLLLEVRYGKKPSRLTYCGLREAIDSAWAGQVDTQKDDRDDMLKLVTAVSPFEPYNQLVGHYNRLRSRSKSTTTRVDSLRLIRQTLNFYRYINRFAPEQFVLVNIPAGELNVFDRSGNRLLPMQVIAGRPDRRTPCMTTYIKRIVAYPHWNVPRRIALEEMLPRMQRNPEYIYTQNLQILDQKDKEVNPEDIDWAGLSATNFPYRVRQVSGCENSLGLLKFDLSNPLAIYLHDTNSRELFALTKDRWRSHGCVRVQKPVELANLVLGKPTFDDDFMSDCQSDAKPRHLAIPKPFPVFITYNTADVDAAGQLRFYEDVYALDK